MVALTESSHTGNLAGDQASPESITSWREGVAERRPFLTSGGNVERQSSGCLHLDYCCYLGSLTVWCLNKFLWVFQVDDPICQIWIFLTHVFALTSLAKVLVWCLVKERVSMFLFWLRQKDSLDSMVGCLPLGQRCNVSEFFIIFWYEYLILSDQMSFL